VKANWVTHHYRFDVSDCFYGYATCHLRPDGDSWKITRKHGAAERPYQRGARLLPPVAPRLWTTGFHSGRL
jgi:hypothetical protein